MMKLKLLLAAAAVALIPVYLVSTSDVASGETVEVFKDANCGCCNGWIDHMRSAGFSVAATDIAPAAMSTRKAEAGISHEHASCHTAFVDGYVVEGHVPAGDVRRLLAEHPDAIGLTAPGMPPSSPGMDIGSEPYDVLLIKPDGTSDVWAKH